MALVVSVVALGVLTGPDRVLADGLTSSIPVILSFEEPQGSGGQEGVTVAVRLTTVDGQPLSRRLVELFVTPAFFGERPVALRSALTDATGTARLTYVPSWEGTHRLTARFAGDEEVSADRCDLGDAGGWPGLDVYT